jgi:hypothetical protein
VRIPFGAEAVLDLPVGPDSAATLAGLPAPERIGPGTHVIVVTDPVVADARRALGERSAV